jgi:hypothetical protein
VTSQPSNRNRVLTALNMSPVSPTQYYDVAGFKQHLGNDESRPRFLVMIEGVTTCKTADGQEAITELASLKLIYRSKIRTLGDSNSERDLTLVRYALSE